MSTSTIAAGATGRRIRLALVGLSSSHALGWASAAHLPYLLSARGRARYEIVALLNSSADAARAAVAAHRLPPAVRAYGDPAALAADPDVDLVVCVTRVDTHHDVMRAVVASSKDVYVEWPLAHDAEHARRLADGLRRGGGGKGVVGLQGGKAPVVAKIAEVLREGRIGKVVSSEVRAYGGLQDRQSVGEKVRYFTQREVGGNFWTIIVAHMFETLVSTFGEPASTKGDFHLQRPDFTILRADGSKETVRSDNPDLILVQARWNESSIMKQDAPLHLRYRLGQPFPGEPALEWTINGEKGEIRVRWQNSSFLSVGDESAPTFFEVHDFATDKVDKVEWDWADWQKELPIPARNIAALYEDYADARDKGAEPGYRTLEYAAKRHELLESVIAGWKA